MKKSFVRVAFALFVGHVVATPIVLNVTGELDAELPHNQLGIAWEDINHSGDGALSAQRLEDPGLLSNNISGLWQPFNDKVTLTRDANTPLNSAITNTLKLSVASGQTGVTGITNKAFGGFEFGTKQNFFVRGAFDGNMTLGVQNLDTGEVSEESFKVHSVAGKWTNYSKNVGPPDNFLGHQKRWILRFDASKVAGRSINIGYPSVIDEFIVKNVGAQLEDDVNRLAPAFIRFPGGANIQGFSPETRWKWRDTLGPNEQRPGRLGAYIDFDAEQIGGRYANSDTLGLVEFLNLCEFVYQFERPVKRPTTPVLTIWSGLPFQPDPEDPAPPPPSSPVPAGSQLKPYVDDALDQLEFILGPINSPGGKLRASLGRDEPWDLKHVEIGNRDDLNGGCESYPKRLMQFYNAINAKYPALTLIASTGNKTCLPSPLPKGLMLDVKRYKNSKSPIGATADKFIQQFSPDNPILIGGFTGRPYPDPSYKGAGITVKTACDEFVFMMAWDRYPEIVKMGAYVNFLSRQSGGYLAYHLPTILSFDDSGSNYPVEVFQSSFYAQSLITHFTGYYAARVKTKATQGPVYWSATGGQTAKKEGARYYSLKLANYQDVDARLNVRMPSLPPPQVNKRHCCYVRNTGESYQSNTESVPQAVGLTDPMQMEAVDGVYQLDLRPYEFGVLVCADRPCGRIHI